MEIKGGATIWARQSIESDIFYKKPAEWFKIWFYIIQKVNHKESKQFKRGEGYFNWSDMKLDLKGITPDQYAKCIKWLKQAKQIATHKTTRGNIILVLNYDKYQTLDNYKSDTESKAGAKQEQSKSYTINKYDKYDKNDKNILSAKADAPLFSFKDKMLLMEKDTNRHINIIHLYWTFRNINIDNNQQYQTLLKREMKPARLLVGFSNERITEVMEYINKNSDFKWTLETVIKYISEDLTKVNNKLYSKKY